jgi:pimeloyl-ACP methyl ester carboxylesterase
MLDSWFIPAAADTERKQAIIFVHGKDGCRTCEFQGNALRFAAAMQQRGFAMLMIDLRGHGQSDDARFTFGIDERRDIEGAVDWLLAQGFQPGSIGLLGVSMGAASSIGAAADEPAIGALVSDSAYAEIYSIMEREFPRQSGLPGFFLPGVSFMTRFVAGQDLAAARPVDEIARIAPRPVFVIHATGDKLISADHAEQLAHASNGSQLWIIDGPGHARTYAVEPRQYVERVATFFSSSLR